MGSKNELKELKKINERYLDNNIDLAKALNTKKQQIADLENELRGNCMEILHLHNFKRENTVLKAELVAKCGQNEKMQAELKQLEDKLTVWRSLFTELMKFNTSKFMEAMQMIGVLPGQGQNAVAQQTLAAQPSLKHAAEGQIDEKKSEEKQIEEKPIEKKQIEKNQSMENKTEEKPPDQNATGTRANELSCIKEVSSLMQSNSEIHTADDLMDYLEETLTPSSLYPLINVNRNVKESEFSDDSITQPFVAMSSNPSKNHTMSFEMPSNTQTMPCDNQIESFEVPNQSKTALFEVTNISRIELLAASIVEDRPNTPKIILSKSSEMNVTKSPRKSDENCLRVPKITIQRKRQSQDRASLESEQLAFNTKSPQKSFKIDQNTSLTLNSSASLSKLNVSLLNGSKRQSLIQITEKSPEMQLASPAMRKKSHKKIIRLTNEKTSASKNIDKICINDR